MSGIDLAGLAAIVGAGNVLTGSDAESYLVDWRSRYRGDALAVVRPADTAEVAAVVGWCGDHDVSVVPQGGNSGLSGGATPINERPSIVLSLRRMNSIDAVDADGWTMTVQAGATIGAIQEAAAASARQFGPDWGARGTATIGGAIATDAGGNNVVRYGNMRDQVLGLEVVLADGRVWDGLRALRKDSSGYDMKQLFIGSEGTLGVVTRAVVKLEPASPHQQSAMAGLAGLSELMAVFALAREVVPDALLAFELMPDIGVAKVCDDYDLTHPMVSRSEFYVLVKVASPQPMTGRLGDFLDRAATAGHIVDAAVASTADQEERLWRIRDELPPMHLYPEAHAAGLKLDAAVPISRMGDYHEGVRGIAAELVPGALAYGFGHVGDGNLHMYVLPLDDGQTEAFRAVERELVRRVDELTFELGGTLSAEHGVGRELRERVVGQKPAVEWQLMRSIKSVIDPRNLFNPGVLLPDE